jgi:hypothetical protein
VKLINLATRRKCEVCLLFIYLLVKLVLTRTLKWGLRGYSLFKIIIAIRTGVQSDASTLFMRSYLGVNSAAGGATIVLGR